jgi:MFS family permease
MTDEGLPTPSARALALVLDWLDIRWCVRRDPLLHPHADTVARTANIDRHDRVEAVDRAAGGRCHMFTESALAAAASDQPADARRRWYAVCLFVTLFAMSFIDRQILSLLAPAISANLQISDTRIGLLFGLGFSLVYTLTGLPLAHLIDRYRRVRLVAAGVALWSACTVASGFATNFTWLLILRSGVALGEAVLSPAAISLIGDLFPRDKRALPTTIYMAAGTVMFTGAFIVGGAALQLATKFAGSFGMQPWQLTLVLVGVPGLVLAPLLLLTVSEPPRADAGRQERYASITEAWDYFQRERMLYAFFYLGIAAIGMVNAARAAWTLTLLVRAHHMDAASAGYAYGAAGVVFGIVGAGTWPLVVKWWTRRGRAGALVTVFASALTASWVCWVVVGFSRSTPLLLTAVGLGDFFTAATAVLAPLLIQTVTPGRLRARATAMYLMAANLVGLALGPPVAALLSEHFFTGPFAIGSGLASLVLAAGPVASISIWLIHKPFLNALSAAEGRETSDA